LALAGFSRRSRTASNGVRAGLAGFAGMLLETVLLLAYQARSGALYGHLGLLLLAFMLGLAAGAGLVDRRRRRAGSDGSQLNELIAALAVSALGALVAIQATTGLGGRLDTTAALAFGAGAVTAAVFASLGSRGPLYSADLAGGAAGSLLAGMVFVPTLGLSATAWLAAATGLAGAVLLVVPILRSRHRSDTSRA
jgi:hypothetical protein